MLFALLFGLAAGTIAALQHRRPLDHLMRFIALLGSSIPVFWLGLVALQIFFVRFHIFPGPVGRLDAAATPPPHLTGLYTFDALIAGKFATFTDSVKHLLLPSMVLGYFILGVIARMVRASLLEVMSMDYVLSARAKGLSERQVVVHHAMRNALIPTTTVVGTAFAGLLSGAVLTETIFAWPGIGRYAVDAAEGQDFGAIMGVTIVVAVVYSLVNIVVDVAYAVIDPRITLSD
jgi:peptide/nickel transport system permease protein